jgi:hypothetical protein
MKIEQRMVPEWGITLDGIWIPYDILEDLSEQDVYDSQFGPAYITPDRDQRRVLVAHGLAVEETRGGLHRGLGLQAFIDAIEWPKPLPRG